jgi:O-antigen ligase
MKLLRVGLCVLFAGSVLALGAVEVWSISLVEMGAATLFFFWALLAYFDPEAKIQWNALNCPLLALIAIGLLQLLFHGTAYAFLTRTELLKLASYFLIFFLTAQAFRERADLVKLGWFVVLLCFAVSLFGIVQHFTSDQEIYWLTALKVDGDPFGPYVNRNHFAGFVELTLPTGLAMMAFRGVKKHLFPIVTVLTIVPVSAIVLSGSRGGIVSFTLEIGILALLAWTRRGLGRKGQWMIAAGVVVLVAAALVAWVGADRAIERFSALHAPEATLSRRVSMSRGGMQIFLHYPIKGCGLGTLVDVYPLYETAYDGKLVDHVHNDYVEGLAETGLLGGLCGMAFLWLLYREARKNFAVEQSRFSRALHGGAIAAVCGLLLHSFVDFNLHIPANALLFLLQVYLVTSPPLAPSSMEPRRKVQSHA